jgi:hypothetical protein
VATVPLLHGLVTYAEVKAGVIDHALCFCHGGTIAAWIYPRSVGESSGRIFGKGKTNIHLRAPSGTTMKLGVVKEFSTNDGVWETSSRVITANEWNHVVITYVQSTSKDPIDSIVYVNGVKQSVTEFITPSGLQYRVMHHLMALSATMHLLREVLEQQGPLMELWMTSVSIIGSYLRMKP